MIAKRPHEAITSYLLCREFGWTPGQLERQKAKDINKMIVIMNEMNALLNQVKDVDDHSITILIEDDE